MKLEQVLTSLESVFCRSTEQISPHIMSKIRIRLTCCSNITGWLLSLYTEVRFMLYLFFKPFIVLLMLEEDEDYVMCLSWAEAAEV